MTYSVAWVFLTLEQVVLKWPGNNIGPLTNDTRKMLDISDNNKWLGWERGLVKEGQLESRVHVSGYSL